MHSSPSICRPCPRRIRTRLGPARARFSDDPPKSEQRRKRRVVSQPVDVDVPRKFADDLEHGRADDVADIGGIRTRVMKRRVLDESVEETTRFQIGNEVR